VLGRNVEIHVERGGTRGRKNGLKEGRKDHAERGSWGSWTGPMCYGGFAFKKEKETMEIGRAGVQNRGLRSKPELLGWRGGEHATN